MTHHDSRDLGFICLVKKNAKYVFGFFRLRIQSWIFFKKRTLRGRGKDFSSVLYAMFALAANRTQGWNAHPSLASSYWKSNKIIVYQLPVQLRMLCFWPMKYWAKKLCYRGFFSPCRWTRETKALCVAIEFWQVAEKLFLFLTLRNHITSELKLPRETCKPWVDPNISAMALVSSVRSAVIASFIVVAFGE